MIFYLIVSKGRKQGMAIEIKADLFLLGSDRMCQIRKDGLGNKHCAIVSREKKVFVRDMDSGQATMLNGSLIPPGEEWPLHAGDRIEVGTLEFQVQFREQAAIGADLEEWAIHCLDRKDQDDEHLEGDEHLGQETAVNAATAILNRLTAMKGLVKGRLRVGCKSGITTISFNDPRLVEESEISLIKKELYENVDQSEMRVLIDMKNVRQMSSAAVAMLAEVHRWIRGRGNSIAFCRIRPELESAMSLLKFENVLIFADKQLAMNSRW